METKVCKKCGIEKNLDEFRLQKKKTKNIIELFAKNVKMK